MNLLQTGFECRWSGEVGLLEMPAIEKDQLVWKSRMLPLGARHERQSPFVMHHGRELAP